MKIVHHDKLKMVRQSVSDSEEPRTFQQGCDSDVTSSGSSSEHSDFSPSDSDDSEEEEVVRDRRYPVRNRQQRVIPGAIPWTSVQL